MQRYLRTTVRTNGLHGLCVGVDNLPRFSLQQGHPAAMERVNRSRRAFIKKSSNIKLKQQINSLQ